MISVERLFQYVNETLASKGQGGYSSNDEFNQHLYQSQVLIFNYYIDRLDNANVSHALSPFIRETTLDLNGAKVGALPVGTVRVIEGGFSVIKNGSQTVYPAHPIKQYEERETLVNSIRKPSLATRTFYYRLTSETDVKFFSDVSGRGYVKYLVAPSVPLRAVTIDTDNQVENYNAGGTTNLQWREAEFDIFVEVLLFLKGVQIKDEGLQAFIQQSRQILK